MRVSGVTETCRFRVRQESSSRGLQLQAVDVASSPTPSPALELPRGYTLCSTTIYQRTYANGVWTLHFELDPCAPTDFAPLSPAA